MRTKNTIKGLAELERLGEQMPQKIVGIPAPQVVLSGWPPGPASFKVLEYTRSPADSRRILVEAEELEEIRWRLSLAGLRTELEDSGAKMFVQPEQYWPVQEAIRAQLPGLELKPRHIVVSEEAEERVHEQCLWCN